MAHSEHFICPNCGENVKVKAKCCPHCGSDENTGWSEKTYLDGIDLPEEENFLETLRSDYGLDLEKGKKKKLTSIIITVSVIILFILANVLNC